MASLEGTIENVLLMNAALIMFDIYLFRIIDENNISYEREMESLSWFCHFLSLILCVCVTYMCIELSLMFNKRIIQLIEK